ncbi:protein of unknown function [Pseudomonas marincola]|uniref:Uncharacterized protein n=1 Tax=Pseudomonas marincola TaxID=437900 RepID=A0A8S2BMU2_9PSED|nr:protein of unknown function [Pseudomonas marincola]
MFEQLGDARVTGVFQIGEDKTEALTLAAAQPGGLRVGAVIVLRNDRENALNGRRGNPPFSGLTVDNVACSGDGNLGQASDIGKFQGAVPER